MISFIYFFIFPFILLYYSYKIMKNTYYVGYYEKVKEKIDVPIWAVIIAIILAFIPAVNVMSTLGFGTIYLIKIGLEKWKYFPSKPKNKNKFINKIKAKIKKPLNIILTFLNKKAW